MPAYFRVACPSVVDAFVVQIKDPGTIEHARELLAGTTSAKPHISGLIVKEPADYNTPWHFHLDPASISFFDSATEVCDAGLRYVEEHLADVGGAFLPGGRWCPWNSRLLEEIQWRAHGG